jgi:hypothetical protein
MIILQGQSGVHRSGAISFEGPKMAQQISYLTPEAYQAAEKYQLGIPTAEYRYKGARGAWVVCLILSFPAVCCFAFLALAPGDGWVWGAMGLLFLLAGQTFLAPTYWNRSFRVYTGSEGLVCLRHGKATICCWDQIKEVKQQQFRSRQYGGIECSYTLVREDGGTVKIPRRMNNINSLGETIQQETARRLIPKVLADYDAGQPVRFGILVVHQQGILTRRGDDRLIGRPRLEFWYWDAIKAIQVSATTFHAVVEGKDNTYTYEVSGQNIPNILVLAGLLDHIVNLGKGKFQRVSPHSTPEGTPVPRFTFRRIGAGTQTDIVKALLYFPMIFLAGGGLYLVFGTIAEISPLAGVLFFFVVFDFLIASIALFLRARHRFTQPLWKHRLRIIIACTSLAFSLSWVATLVPGAIFVALLGCIITCYGLTLAVFALH